MKSPVRGIALACVIALSSGVALAADNEPAAPAGNKAAAAAPDKLAGARQLIASKQWTAAISELKQVNATGDADWNNLMGYTHRKQKTPDFAAAARYYDAALQINPKHLASLEYKGELALQQGDLPGAEKQLAILEKASFLKSEEFKQLKAAIDNYKANGNKYVSKD